MQRRREALRYPNHDLKECWGSNIVNFSRRFPALADMWPNAMTFEESLRDQQSAKQKWNEQGCSGEVRKLRMRSWPVADRRSEFHRARSRNGPPFRAPSIFLCSRTLGFSSGPRRGPTSQTGQAVLSAVARKTLCIEPFIDHARQNVRTFRSAAHIVQLAAPCRKPSGTPA